MNFIKSLIFISALAMVFLCVHCESKVLLKRLTRSPSPCYQSPCVWRGSKGDDGRPFIYTESPLPMDYPAPDNYDPEEPSFSDTPIHLSTDEDHSRVPYKKLEAIV